MADRSVDAALKVLFASETGQEVLKYVEKKVSNGNGKNISQAGVAGAVPREPVGMGSPTIPDEPLKGTVYDNPPVPQISVDDELQRKIDAINEAIRTGRDVKEVLKEFGF